MIVYLNSNNNNLVKGNIIKASIFLGSHITATSPKNHRNPANKQQFSYNFTNEKRSPI